MSQVVPPVLHMKLGTVLKLYQILLSKTKEKDFTETTTARADQEKEWESMSMSLLEKEAELVHTGCVFVDLENLKDQFQAVFSEDWQKLDDIAKRSDNSLKKSKEKMRGADLLYAALQIMTGILTGSSVQNAPHGCIIYVRAFHM